MTEELKKAIDEAIDTLPRDVLSHVSADRECFPALLGAPASEWNREADAKVLWKWIREHFRRVLVALAKDQNAQSRLAKALPKPWVYDNLKWPDLSNLSPEAKAECERVDKENDAILASLHPYERKCCAIGLCQPPPEAQKAIDEAEEKYQKEQRQWSGEFWAAPSVWVWALWHVWPKVTGRAAIPGCPEWPGVKRLSKDKQSTFLVCIDLGIGPEINCYPNLAANMLNDALGQLRDGPTGEPSDAETATQATPDNDPALIYQADAAECYNIPKSWLCKAAKKKPGEPGYLWSGRDKGKGKGKRKRVWYRKKDLVAIARSRKAVGRTSQSSEKLSSQVSPRVSSGKNLEENQRAFLTNIGQNETESEG